MINSQPYSMTITAHNDWMGNQYNSFAGRVAWIKRNFKIVVIDETTSRIQFTTTQDNLTCISEVIENSKDRIDVMMRFA